MIYFADVIKPCIKERPRGATESDSWFLSRRFRSLMLNVSAVDIGWARVSLHRAEKLTEERY